MGYLEEFLQYLVRNAYVVVALDGTPLYSSGKKAFKMLKKNFASAVSLNYFGDFVLFLAKVFVVLISVFINYELVQVI